MSRRTSDNIATAAKVNVGLQFVRFSSGQIGFWQFINFAFIQPVKLAIYGFIFLSLLILIPIEAYCWYIEHTSFTYHLIKGDLDSISGKNSRKWKTKLAEREKAENQDLPYYKKPEISELTKPAEVINDTKTTTAAETRIDEPAVKQEVVKDSYRSTDDLNRVAATSSTQALKVADDELNKVYKRVMKSLPVTDTDSFRMHQRSWIKSRDWICRDMEGEMRNSCLMEQTEKRTEYIKEFESQMH